MAGEVEDRVGLQGEYLPTGSISFGRFDSEVLSWEKRSSFKHNRYLDEVEKFSTAGAVNQKKAYFEAHFKKRVLLREASSLSQSGSEGHGNEGGSEDHTICTDEYENSLNRHEEDEQHDNLRNQDNGSVGSSGNVEFLSVVTEEASVQEISVGNENVAFSSGGSGEGTPLSDGKLSESNTQDQTYVEQDQISLEHDVSSILVESQVFVEQELTRILQNEGLGKDLQRVDAHVEIDDSSCRAVNQKSSYKGKPSMEHRTVKQKSQPSDVRRLHYPSTEKKSVKNHPKPGFNSSQQSRQGKKTPLIVSSATPSTEGFMKSEDSKDFKAKRTQLTKSQNDMKLQKGPITPRFISVVKESGIAPSSRRHEKMVSSSTSVLKAAREVISFKCNERDATQKEGGIARVSDTSRSLNLKAAPRPSFHRDAPHEAVSRASVQYKAPSRSIKPPNGSTGSRTTSLSKRENAPKLCDPKARPKLNPSSATHRPVSSAAKTGIGSNKQLDITKTSTGLEGNKSKVKLSTQPRDKLTKSADASKVSCIKKMKGSISSTHTTVVR